MTHQQYNYLANIKTLHKLTLPNPYKVTGWLISVVVLFSLLLLWYTPWIQTAYGTGVVDTLNPTDRTQAISALVAGQIETWHVREGDKVKAGDPIVTLIDADKALVSRLNNQLNATKQRHEANLSALATAKNNLRRQRELLAGGFVSEREVEMVEISIEDLRGKAASSEAELSQLNVSLTRQSMQTKVAPQDGTILRLIAGGSATFVKASDVLAQFIPDSAKRSVVVKVSGLDALMVRKGRKVRLQFEGWPVFQFSGWPSTAIGTFGGEVAFIEPVADELGQFKVWINEDAEDAPWPDKNFVRLGSRVRAWILLEEVRLGFELWRQLNNFPPQQPQGDATGA